MCANKRPWGKKFQFCINSWLQNIYIIYPQLGRGPQTDIHENCTHTHNNMLYATDFALF